MPAWQIHTGKNVFSAEDKIALAEKITQFYCDVVKLPRFYTSVVFQEWDRENFILGGEAVDDFVMIEIIHVARNMEELSERYGVKISTDDLYKNMRESFAAIVKPFTDDRGLRWECAVLEGLFDSWMINGIKPPAPWSEEEQKWARQNKATPYDTEAATVAS